MKPTLLVLAAGMSSRYGGQSKQTDALGPHGETLLDYSVFDAIRAGFGRVVFIIRREGEAVFRERVVSRLQPWLPIDLVYQDIQDLPAGFESPAARSKPWGTGHAVLAAREAIREPFCVINADDFYGREAFSAMAAFLTTPVPPGPMPLAMCGYELRRTLSEHGKVARGICTTSEGGLLVRVEELTDIFKTENGAENRPADQPVQPLTGHETVSMNMWGFQPGVFPAFMDGLSAFLEHHLQDPKAEYYIPLAVDRLLQNGTATCAVLPTAAQWFGVTYQEDKPRVQESLRRIFGDGSYPSPLWS
ncbi:MAG: hypothetical protein JWL81_247 [Verrucomicrobiales bacterium]|nr:hypothetical protein [Verrucomicrobiales bacterium]